MNTNQIKEIIRNELPAIMRDDAQMRDFVINITRTRFADRNETDSRFDRIIDELRRDREEQSRKWDEQNRKWDLERAEQNKKWDEQNKKWDEQNKKWDEQNKKWDEQNKKWYLEREEQNKKWDEQNKKWDLEREEQNKKWNEQSRKWEANQKDIKKLYKKIEIQFGALGARWGIRAEESFRNALKGILEDSFGVRVLNVTEFDDEGEVFDSPDQVELDIIIKNGTLIICEIKSSMSRGDVAIFSRKIAFYEKRHNRKADRNIIITPMIDKYARRFAEKRNMEIYTSPDDIGNL